MKEDRTLPNSVFEASKARQRTLTRKEENYTPISIMSIDAKYSTKYLKSEIRSIVKCYTSRPTGMYTWPASMIQRTKINQNIRIHQNFQGRWWKAD